MPNPSMVSTFSVFWYFYMFYFSRTEVTHVRKVSTGRHAPASSGNVLMTMTMTMTIGLFKMQGLRPIIQTYKHNSIVVIYYE